jgi:hypothetical protein
MTGITTASSSTITVTFPTAESLPIATPSITRAQTSIVATDFAVEADFRAAALGEIRGSADQPRNTDSPLRMSSRVVVPARSAALITEELREGFPPAGSRASAAEVSTAVEGEAFTAAEATGNPV